MAAGQTTAQTVVAGWLKNPGHRRNIENPVYDEIGLGLGQTDEGMKNYWCQVFGTSEGQVGANAPSCRAAVGAEGAGSKPGLHCLLAAVTGSMILNAVWTLL